MSSIVQKKDKKIIHKSTLPITKKGIFKSHYVSLLGCGKDSEKALNEQH